MSNNIAPGLASVIENLKKTQGNVIFSDDLPKRGLVPFTSPYLNEATRGGLPRGVSNEIAGDEHTGKTTLALDIIKNYQKIARQEYLDEKKALEEEIKTAKGKKLKDAEEKLANLREKITVYIDLEHTLNPEWITKLGVDISEDRVFFYQAPPTGAEDALDVVIDLLETGDVGAIVVDSVGVMISTAENESDMSKGNFGGISKALTKFYKKAIPYTGMNNVLLLMINQTREDMSGYNRFIRPGGKAHAFAQSTVLRLRPSSDHLYEQNYKKGSGNSVGIWAKGIKVQVNKLKQASNRTTNTVYTIRVGRGVDRLYDTLHMSKELGFITQAGAFYTFWDEKTGEEISKQQGEYKALKFLGENPELLDNLWNRCYDYSITDLEDE